MAGPRNKDAGWTPLHLATYAGHKEMVKMLVRGGASVNARTEMGLNPLYFGLTEWGSQHRSVPH